VRRLALQLLLACVVVLGLPAAPIAATNPDEILADPVLEQRARELSKQLRCLVCQNQSIDDSDADLARDLRRIVRERLTAGDTDDQVMAFVTARYGDYVLLRPPLRAGTLALWFGPVVLLVAGIAAIMLRRRRRVAAEPFSAEEDRRLAQLLDHEKAP
jgi:cytochrome c-type biogenesis protein CcmH